MLNSSINFKALPFCTNTAVPAFLPCLEASLKSLFGIKHDDRSVASNVKKKTVTFYVAYKFCPPHWCLHLIAVRRFEYVSDPESYNSSSVATGRASLAGQVKG